MARYGHTGHPTFSPVTSWDLKGDGARFSGATLHPTFTSDLCERVQRVLLAGSIKWAITHQLLSDTHEHRKGSLQGFWMCLVGKNMKNSKKYIKHTCTHCTLKRRTVYSNLTVQQPLQLSVLPAWNPPSQSSLHSIVFVQNISTSSFSWFKFRLESCIILKINVRVLAHKLSTNGRWWWCYAEAEQQLANKMSGRVRRKQLPQHVVIKEAATPVCVQDDRWPTLSLWQQGGTFLLTNCWRDTSEFSSLWHRVAPRIQSVFVCLLIVQR